MVGKNGWFLKGCPLFIVLSQNLLRLKGNPEKG